MNVIFAFKTNSVHCLVFDTDLKQFVLPFLIYNLPQNWIITRYLHNYVNLPQESLTTALDRLTQGWLTKEFGLQQGWFTIRKF